MPTSVSNVLAATFQDRFGYAPCSCWSVPTKVAMYSISTENNSIYNNGSQVVKKMYIRCSSCGKEYVWNCEDRGITDQDVDSLG